MTTGIRASLFAPSTPSPEELLCAAAESGDAGSVAELLAAGADPTHPGASGLTPLMHAVVGGHAAVVRLLLDVGAPCIALSASSAPSLLSDAARGFGFGSSAPSTATGSALFGSTTSAPLFSTTTASSPSPICRARSQPSSPCPPRARASSSAPSPSSSSSAPPAPTSPTVAPSTPNWPRGVSPPRLSQSPPSPTCTRSAAAPPTPAGCSTECPLGTAPSFGFSSSPATTASASSFGFTPSSANKTTASTVTSLFSSAYSTRALSFPKGASAMNSSTNTPSSAAIKGQEAIQATSEYAALKVFDELPNKNVVWDEEPMEEEVVANGHGYTEDKAVASASGVLEPGVEGDGEATLGVLGLEDEMDKDIEGSLCHGHTADAVFSYKEAKPSMKEGINEVVPALAGLVESRLVERAVAGLDFRASVTAKDVHISSEPDPRVHPSSSTISHHLRFNHLNCHENKEDGLGTENAETSGLESSSVKDCVFRGNFNYEVGDANRTSRGGIGPIGQDTVESAPDNVDTDTVCITEVSGFISESDLHSSLMTSQRTMPDLEDGEIALHMTSFAAVLSSERSDITLFGRARFGSQAIDILKEELCNQDIAVEAAAGIVLHDWNEVNGHAMDQFTLHQNVDDVCKFPFDQYMEQTNDNQQHSYMKHFEPGHIKLPQDYSGASANPLMEQGNIGGSYMGLFGSQKDYFGPLLQSQKQYGYYGDPSGMLVVVTRASHVIYGSRGIGVPAKISKKMQKKKQVVILLDPERQGIRREGEIPIADFLWYSAAKPCSRNCFDHAEIARVMNVAGRRHEALPQDLQKGIDLGVVSSDYVFSKQPEHVHSFYPTDSGANIDLDDRSIILEIGRDVQWDPGIRKLFL